MTEGSTTKYSAHITNIHTESSTRKWYVCVYISNFTYVYLKKITFSLITHVTTKKNQGPPRTNIKIKAAFVAVEISSCLNEEISYNSQQLQKEPLKTLFNFWNR